ncbi:DUF1127 domain-containing protein [Litoreibacter arenae]|uniref:DUF1127 domain-containing protein n=1 Tax=Litoreibacter arenae TaxID=491388 RepID=UPI0005925ECD
MTDLTCTTPLRRTDRRIGFMGYFALYRQRKALAALDDTSLTDIGLTRAEADAEAQRPVWDAPAHWR